MQQRKLGNSGLQVSRLGLGTMAWGRDISWPEAKKLALRFVEAGGTLIDTAPAYGAGAAEKMIGKLIHTDINRDDVVIASKGGFVVQDGKRIVDTSRTAMLADLENTLRRLHTDHIDLWQIHAWGNAPIEETLSAIDTAVSKGLVRYAGVSNFVGWQTATAATWQKALPGRARIVSAQIEYSLLARRAEVEVLSAAKGHDIGVIAWSALGRGVLTGKYRTETPLDSRGAADHFAWFVAPYMNQRSRSIVEATAKAAEGLNLSPAQVALLWVRDAPQVSSALIGPRTPEQLDNLLATEERSLPTPIVTALDDISGGPNNLREVSDSQIAK